jgi:putative inorganic carbon (HCO3(-)) transporter
MRLVRAAPYTVFTLFFLVPLYPSFITLTGVTPPGVSLLPKAATMALFGVCIAGVLSLLGALLYPPRVRIPLLLPLLCWLAAALLAALLGFDPSAGAVFLAIFSMEVIGFASVLRFFEAGAARALAWSFPLSACVASLVAIAMVVLRAPPAVYAIAHGRAVGTFILPGELAGYLILALPFAFGVLRTTADARLRALCVAALVTGSVAFVMTFSRAGWIGMAAAIACYALWRGSLRRRYAPAILAGGLGAVLVLFNVHHNPAENYTRLSIWQTALEIIRRFPLTGVGPFDFAHAYALLRPPGGDAQAFHAHDIVLTFFAETGIVGVAAMLWAWWSFGTALRERLRSASPAGSELALALAAGLAGTWVQGLIDTVSVVIFGLWLPVMALALAWASSGQKEVV